MEKDRNTYAHPIMHEFLLTALADGARETQPSWIIRKKTIHYLKPDLWAKQLNITGIYYGTSLSCDEIGQMYGNISREAVRQIIEKGVSNLHKNSSAETQVKFPLVNIPLGKSLHITNNLDNKAATNAGKLAIVSSQLENGTNNPDQITTNTNLSKKEVRLALRLLKSQSRKSKEQEIHRKYQSRKDTWQTISNIVKHSEDRVLTQAAIDILDEYHAKNIAEEEDSSLLTFSEILGKHPMRFAKKIDIILKAANIPVMKYWRPKQHSKHDYISYHVPKRFAEEAVNVLENSPLKSEIKSKVQQIAGPATSTMPSTTEFALPKKFKKVGNLNPSLKFSSLKNISLQELYSGCPVPVYMYTTTDRTRYIYLVENEQEVKQYLDKRLRELGIRPRPHS